VPLRFMGFLMCFVFFPKTSSYTLYKRWANPYF